MFTRTQRAVVARVVHGAGDEHVGGLGVRIGLVVVEHTLLERVCPSGERAGGVVGVGVLAVVGVLDHRDLVRQVVVVFPRLSAGVGDLGELAVHVIEEGG